MTSTPVRDHEIHPTITNIATPEGATIRWEMTVEEADELMTLLARVALSDHDPVATSLIDPLWHAVSVATDAAATYAGCEGLWPDAAPMSLTEPAVIGNDTGDLLAVLIPGQHAALDAIATALTVAREAGAIIDPTDESLVAEVQHPRWMVLNSCESDTHDFHPELAAHGPITPGAVLITRVDITHV